MATSFTEGVDHSVSGGGLEHEIKHLKSLLGLLAKDFNLRVISPSITPDDKYHNAFYGYQINDTMLKDRDFN